jgi:GH3 auxin-responsive promoter
MSARGRVEELRQELGPKVTLLEMAQFPEGLVAVEDPRHGLLHLLADDGVYCEFIRAEQSGKRSPERVGLSQAEIGVSYELALTSPAGVWSCRTGAAVCFERLDPPLFRFVEMPRIEPASRKPDVVTVTRQDTAEIGFKPPALHRPNAGSPAAPPESYGHNPWLVPVDRG